MKTERLYLQDAYLETFSARIVERELLPGRRLAVVLDRTAFCPARSAGRPADRGWLDQTQVVDVVLRERDGEILHLLSDEIWKDEVQARLDWPRRLDMMRQHTAGHLIAQALAHVSGAATPGIIISEHDAYLDLSRGELSPAHIEQAEKLANESVLSNRAVRVTLVDAAQAGQLGLRAPMAEANPSPGPPWPRQVVSIEGAGVTICDGVHVARTGEVGLIKILGCELQPDRLRVRFACGARALAEFRRLEQTLAQIAASLGVDAANVAPVVARLTSVLNATRLESDATRNKMIHVEADGLAGSAPTVGGARVVRRVYAEGEHDVIELRQLAHLIVARPGLVALLGVTGDKAQLVFARSADVQYDMTMFIRAAAQMLNTSGGGQPALAESVATRADKSRVEAAIAKAYKLWQAQR